MANELNGLKLTAEEKKKLEAAGVRVFYGEIPNRKHTLRELARTTDMAEAWVRVQLKKGEIKGAKEKDGNRKIWKVTAAEVARIRQEQVDKHLGRLERKASGQKYASYKRPTQWAYDLTTKAIEADSKLDEASKDRFLAAMERYKVAWQKAYDERVAKREAKEAEK